MQTILINVQISAAEASQTLQPRINRELMHWFISPDTKSSQFDLLNPKVTHHMCWVYDALCPNILMKLPDIKQTDQLFG